MTFLLPPPPEKALFKNATNTRYLKGLFYEFAEDRATCLYCLKESDWAGYPSLYQIYMEVSDPEEYLFATQYLEGYDHWEKLCECTWFKPYVTKWRKHLDKKVKAEALSRIIKEARNESSKNLFSCNRFLTEKGWASNSRGRPSKGEIAATAFEIASTDRRLLDDMDRVLSIKPEVVRG